MNRDSHGDVFASEWRRLQSAQLELRRALATERSDKKRQRLMAELAAARTALADLEVGRVAAADPAPADAGGGAVAVDGAVRRDRSSRVAIGAAVIAAVAVTAIAFLSLTSGRGDPFDPASPEVSRELASEPLQSAGGAGTQQAEEPAASPSTTGGTVHVPVRRVAIITPSPRSDRAFSQSMVDGMISFATDRGAMEVAIVDDVGGAAAGPTITRFAESGYDLVIAHSAGFEDEVVSIAARHPEVTFAVGTVAGEPELDNVYTYTVATDEGGFVLGAIAAWVTEGGVVGAVGPVDVGVSGRFVDAFVAGAGHVDPGVNALGFFAGSFDDPDAAARVAQTMVDQGADVMTAHVHDNRLALAVAEDHDAAWLGSQIDYSVIARDQTMASQVYHWEVLLEPIVAGIGGSSGPGRHLIADLANGGIEIAFSPFQIAPTGLQTDVDDLVAAIVDGSIDPLG